MREMVGLTQESASALVHVQARTWLRWEQEGDKAGKRWMPEAAVELFCLKTGLFYPPQFSVEMHEGIMRLEMKSAEDDRVISDLQGEVSSD